MSFPSYQRVIERYGRLAHRYDRRWRAYTERILLELLEALTLSGTERVLDVGCGTGEFERLVIERFPQLTLVGVDVTPAMVELARQKLAGSPHVTFQVAQAESLPFRGESFDVVVSANTLHHVRTPGQFAQECVRVLRPGGQIVIVDWCRDFWHCRLLHYWWTLVDPSYVQMYRLQEAACLFEEADLTLEETKRFTAPRGYGMMQLKGRKRSALSTF